MFCVEYWFLFCLGSFVEPDFEFMLYPSDKGSYYMEWKFNLWDGGVLTCNSFTLTFVDEDIQELIKYLKTVMEDKTKK